MRTVYLFLVAVLRVSAWALVGCIDAIRTVAGWWAEVAESDDPAPNWPEIETPWSMEALDNPIRFTTKERRIF